MSFILKIKQSIKDIFRIIDIFAINPCFLFSFKQKQTYSTLITKLMTIIVILISLLCFIYFSLNLINKTNPYIVTSKSYSLDPELFQMSKNIFPITIAVENITNNYIPFVDDSIYRVEAYFQIRKNEIYESIPIKIEKCEIIDLPMDEELKQYLIKNHYDQSHCLKNFEGLEMKGTWDSDIFKELKIKIRPCNNSTDNGICKTEEEIERVIEGSYIVLKHPTYSIDPNNYKNPLKFHGLNNFSPISLKTTTHLYLYFGEIKVSTDIGMILEDIIEEKVLQFNSEKISIYARSSLSEKVCVNIFFRLDGKTKTVKRKYDKIQDILSSVGGLIKFTTFIGYIIINNFIREAFLQRLSNDVFDYEEFIKDNNNENKFQLKTKIKPQSPINIKTKVKMSFWEFIKSKFKKENDKKLSVIKKSVKLMEKNLDISRFLNKLLEIEKLKFVLDEQQYNKLEEINKPKIITKQKTILSKNEKEKNYYKEFFIRTSSNELDDEKIKKNKQRKGFSKQRISLSENAIELFMKESKFKSNLQNNVIDEIVDENNKNKEIELFVLDLKNKKFEGFEVINDEDFEKNVNSSISPHLINSKNNK